MGEVAAADFDAEPSQRAGKESEGVAEKMAGGDDVLPCGAKGKEGIGDGCHARTEGYHIGGIGQHAHLALEIGDGGVCDA